MGFTTGFTGGVTLTLGLAYLTVLTHKRNRQSQALYLRSQSQLLNSLLDPTLVQPTTNTELIRQPGSTFTEAIKDRWNEEVENAVRWIHVLDWSDVREGMEGAVARLLGRGLQESRGAIEEAEKLTGSKVQEAVDQLKATAKKSAEKAAVGLNDAAAATIAGAQRASEAVESTIDGLAVSARESIDQTGGDTQSVPPSIKASTERTAVETAVEMEAGEGHAIATARSAMEHDAENGYEIAEVKSTDALQNVTGKGIEEGKRVVGNAQATTGLATEKIDSVSNGKDSGLGVSDVEKALRERYGKPKGFDRTVEEVLDERYKSIDQRDSTVLRGV